MSVLKSEVTPDSSTCNSFPVGLSPPILTLLAFCLRSRMPFTLPVGALSTEPLIDGNLLVCCLLKVVPVLILANKFSLYLLKSFYLSLFRIISLYIAAEFMTVCVRFRFSHFSRDISLEFALWLSNLSFSKFDMNAVVLVLFH